MKSKTPVIWDRKPPLKSLVESILDDLIAERIVTFDGTEYDIEEDEIDSIHQRLEMGYVGVGMQGSNPGEEVEDRTYDVNQGVSTLAKNYQLDSTQKAMLDGIVTGFAASGDLGSKAVRILANADDGFPLFTYQGDSYPDHPATAELLALKHDVKTAAVGRGEVLATLLYGAEPPDVGEETDIFLVNFQPGGWHVKSTASPNANTPWGESKAAKAAFWGSLKRDLTSEEISAIKDKAEKEGETVDGVTGENQKIPFSPPNAATILLNAGIPESRFQTIADALDSAMAVTAASGNAKGVLFSEPGQFVFKPAEDIKFGDISSGGRVSVANSGVGSFWSRMKGYARKAAAENLVSSMGQDPASLPPNIESIRDQWLSVGDDVEERSSAFTTKQLSNIIRRVNSISDDGKAPSTKMPVSGNKDRLFGLLNSYLTGKEVSDWIDSEDSPDLDTSGKINSGKLLAHRVRRILVIEKALNEELTRADKKDIEKMIAKRIEADRAEQKRQFKKHLAEELKSSKFQKLILEMAKDEMGRELKGKQLEGAVLEITKKVIKKLYL